MPKKVQRHSLCRCDEPCPKKQLPKCKYYQQWKRDRPKHCECEVPCRKTQIRECPGFQGFKQIQREVRKIASKNLRRQKNKVLRHLKQDRDVDIDPEIHKELAAYASRKQIEMWNKKARWLLTYVKRRDSYILGRVSEEFVLAAWRKWAASHKLPMVPNDWENFKARVKLMRAKRPLRSCLYSGRKIQTRVRFEGDALAVPDVVQEPHQNPLPEEEKSPFAAVSAETGLSVQLLERIQESHDAVSVRRAENEAAIEKDKDRAKRETLLKMATWLILYFDEKKKTTLPLAQLEAAWESSEKWLGHFGGKNYVSKQLGLLNTEYTRGWPTIVSIPAGKGNLYVKIDDMSIERVKEVLRL